MIAATEHETAASMDAAQADRDADLFRAVDTLLGAAPGRAAQYARLLGGAEELVAPDLAARLERAGVESGACRRAAAVVEAAASVGRWWPATRRRVQSPGDLAALATPLIGRSRQEELYVAVVDGRNGLLALRRVYAGTATGTSVRIAELVRPVLDLGGVGFAAVHNHPSGDPQPSDEDVRLTAELLAAARLLDLEFLDHLVIGHDRWASIRSQRGEIWAGDERRAAAGSP
jgi:DNA repair protein RadC